MSTKTRFEKEAKGNSEVVYCCLDLLFVNYYLEVYWFKQGYKLNVHSDRRLTFLNG